MRASLPLARNSFFYFLAVGANKGMPFLLVPLLTRYLTVEEFGYLGIATVVLGVLTIFAGFNPSLFVIRNFCRLDHEDAAGYVYHGLVAIAVAFVVSAFMLWVFSDLLSANYDLGFDMLLVLAATGALMAIAALALTVIQMEKNASLFFKYSLVSAAFQFSLVVVIVVWMSGGWKGKLVADLLAAILFATILMSYLRSRSYVKLGYSWQMMRSLLAFSLPLLPHTLALWGMNFIDRFFLVEMVDMKVVGLYSAAYTIGMGMMLLHDSLQRAWQPYFFERLLTEEQDHKAKIVRYIWLYYLGCIIMFFVYVGVVSLVMPYLMGEDFQVAFRFIPLIVLGFTFFGMYRVVASLLYHVNRTGVLAAVSVTAAALNAVLNYVLILYNGAIGAAQATAVTFFFSFIAVKLLAMRYYDMPWFTFHMHQRKGQ